MRNSTVPTQASGEVVELGGVMEGSCLSTSVMRRAQIMARGSIIAMKVPIMTAARIWSRYCRNAVSEPTLTKPSSTRWPPNHRTAPVATLRITVMSGNITTKSRPMFKDRRVIFLFSSVKRSDS